MCVRCQCIRALCFLLVTIVSIHGFNLNWNYARIFSDNSRGSYFGFSVQFRKEQSLYKLFVGAPRANNSVFERQANLIEPGVAYQCSLNNDDPGRACSLLRLDISGNIVASNLINHNKHHSWFGGVIAVNDQPQQGTVVCAPRWKNDYSGHYLMNGICYFSNNPGITDDRRKKELKPLIEIRKQGLHVRDEQVFFYAYGESGFTAHFPKNSSELILGAPGVYDWRGAIIRYRKGYFDDDQYRREKLELIDVPFSMKTQITDNSYLGYSLSSGRFFKSEGSKHFYVSGAPRAAGYKGRVFVFDFPEDNNDGLQIKLILDGTQMGEYFGGSLCVADLNGDGMDDLVVGAPQYSRTIQNAGQIMGDEGRIYVYISEDWNSLKHTTDNIKIMGNRKFGARFGTAVANVGDLNYDGCEDIAVGAPYEDNGVVYIYHGRRSGVPLELMQIIHGKDINPNMLGLGISFSKGMDIDGNHYNDIAVGAFESGHAVLLRGHPIITFHSRLEADITRITNSSTNFTVTACLHYKGAYPPNTVETNIGMKVDGGHGRAHIVDGSIILNARNYSQNLIRDKESCLKIKITVDKEMRDPTRPVDIVMTYDLKHNPALQEPRPPNSPDKFCRDCPVVDINHARSRAIKVPFKTGCKTDVCIPDLSIHAEFTEVKDKLVLGERQSLEMVVDVRNKGDPAFTPVVRVTLPNSTPLLRIPQSCRNDPNTEKKRILICDIGYSLQKNKTIKFQMDVKDIPVDKKSLLFEVNVTSSGEEATPHDNSKNLTLDLVVQADMTIIGSSSREQISYISQNNTILKDLSVNHTYVVYNLGPSRVEKVEILFSIPHLFLRDTNEYKKIVPLLEPTVTSQDSGSIHCEVIGSYSFEQKGHENSTLNFDGGTIERKEESIHHIPSLRTKRSTGDDEYLEVSSQTPANKTLAINCNNNNVECVKVVCYAGPFYANKSRAIISFQLNLTNLELLDNHLASKDIIVLSTKGEIEMKTPPAGVQPKVHKPDSAVVHTMYLGKVSISDGSIPTWIIAVAIICGLLILCLIAMALHKLGFFKREKKDELEALKEAEAEADADE